MLYYILKDKNVVPTNDIQEWGRFFESADRIVKKDTINSIDISTVFLGLDHGWGDPFPLLFETMVFGGEHDQFQARYTVWEEAEEGHERAVEMVKASLKIT